MNDDTKTWVGTITPSNYTMDQSGQTSKAKYTIDYSSYKARLITANEIAQITGYTAWDEKTTDRHYFFDSKTSTASTTCKRGDISGCKYGWLYDRTNTGCTDFGCLNNSDQVTSGYWTASSRATFYREAWGVYYPANVTTNIVEDSNLFGIRPVITISKSQLG